MSEFLSRIKARLETGQHLNCSSFEDAGWVRAAVVGADNVRRSAEDAGEVHEGPKNTELLNGWQMDLVERMKGVGLGSQDGNDFPANLTLSGGSSNTDDVSPQSASQRLWETGRFDSRIPNGFYSIVPSKVLKAQFETIPSLVELKTLGKEYLLAADMLVVDAAEDLALARLRELAVSSVKSLGENPPMIVKKIAEMVADFYGGPLFEAGVFKHPMDEPQSTTSPQFLGQIKVGLCRPRALLFKFLGDAVGLHSRLLMGLRLDEVSSSSLICANPNKHLSNIVCLNDMELLVDVMRHPGHLRPFSRRTLIMYHTAGAGDSDSADYDSCDSPLEPNSPLFGYPDNDSLDHEFLDSPGLPLRRRQSSPVSVHNVMIRVPGCLEGKLSPSRSEPDLSNPDRRRGRRRAVPDERAAACSPERPLGFQQPIRGSDAEAVRSFPSSPEHPQARLKPFRRFGSKEGSISSSPEHPSFRVRPPSMLGGGRRQGGEEGDFVGISSPEQSPQHLLTTGNDSQIFRRRRERSLSIDIQRDNLDFLKTGGEAEVPRVNNSPEIRKMKKKGAALGIGDDVVRAVRAMNEAIKLERTRSKSSVDLQAKEVIEELQGKESSEQFSAVESDPSSTPGLLRVQSIGSVKTKTVITTDQQSTASTCEDPVARSPADRNESHTFEEVVDSKPALGEAASSTLTLNPPAWLQPCPLIPFSEWNIDFKEIRFGVRVGIGSFGEVFRGVWRGTEIAIKVLLEQDLTEENTTDFCTEIALLSRLRHPNVVLFMGACTTPPHLSLVTEYMHMGSIYSLVHTTGQGKKLSWQRRLKMLRDICRGMLSVQRMNVVHCDLKSANCLVDKHWCVKICDFGLSRLASGDPVTDTSVAGTPEWMAPELLRNEHVTHKCDIFSLGVIMWELCTLKRPWEGVKPMQVVLAVAHKQARLEIPDGFLGKLIADCWAEDPAARPTYEEILTRLHECEFLQG